MEYFFRVMTSVHEGEGVDPYADNCPKKARVWKISSLTDTYGNNLITAVNIPAPKAIDSGAVVNDPAALSSWLTLAQLGKGADMSGINVTFAGISGAALGQTVGYNITLDTNAAGYTYISGTLLA